MRLEEVFFPFTFFFPSFFHAWLFFSQKVYTLEGKHLFSMWKQSRSDDLMKTDSTLCRLAVNAQDAKNQMTDDFSDDFSSKA